MANSDNMLRDKALRDRDRALRDGVAPARQGQAAPPDKAKLGWLRVFGAIGRWISARVRTVWRKTAVAFRSVAGLPRHLMRREGVLALAAVIAAAIAVFTWRQSIDAESRQVSGELLSRINSDEMLKARLTLERYYYLSSGDRTSPADVAKQTEEYFKFFVYQRTASPAGRLTDRVKFGSDREKQEEFFRQVDQSRRKIKNFYEDVVAFTEGRLITATFKEKVLKRSLRDTGDFLECFWLPVELGQNAAMYQGRKADNDKRACQVVDWYREKFPVAGRSVSPCVAYAARQPDFCVAPRVEALLSE